MSKDEVYKLILVTNFNLYYIARASCLCSLCDTCSCAE